jgi:hypothetical protein
VIVTTPADVLLARTPAGNRHGSLRVSSRQPTVAVSGITTHVSCCSFVIISIIEAMTSMGTNIRSIPDVIALDESIGAIQLVPTACS